MSKAEMHEMVEVGKDRLIGEIIRLDGDVATIQKTFLERVYHSQQN
jgi:vacuolar-type H+-ATPase catalytic subunit A/Vma1